MIPAIPSLKWWSIHMESLLNGADVTEALLTANRLCSLAGKDFVRGTIANDMQLAIPLEGGASVSKRLRADSDMQQLKLSDHGKWRREQLGAFSAAYGKTPYFIHLYPELEEIYALSEENSSFQTFTLNLYNLTRRWIGEYFTLHSDTPQSETIRLCMEEFKKKVNTEISIFDAIFRFGKETALCL
jgi:hypothetical protein